MNDWRSHVREWIGPGGEQESVSGNRDLRGARTGTTLVDEDAFRSFYERTAPVLRSYLRLQGADAALADDLLQDGFVRFLRANVPDLNEFQMKAYLYKAALSALRDHHRARARELRRNGEIQPERREVRNPHLSPDMQQVFARLDERQQSLLWLAYVEGFRHSEIADLIGMGEKSVRVALYRARRQLAALLHRQGLGPGKDT